MTEDKNALARLAKVMDEPVDMASIHDRGLVVLNAKQFSAYQKARRIVAELAKVKNIEEFGIVHVREDMAIDAVEACRAISEEGN